MLHRKTVSRKEKQLGRRERQGPSLQLLILWLVVLMASLRSYNRGVILSFLGGDDEKALKVTNESRKINRSILEVRDFPFILSLVFFLYPCMSVVN